MVSSRVEMIFQLVDGFSDEMESFFEPRATAIVNLIQGQVEQVQRLRTKLRVIQISMI